MDSHDFYINKKTGEVTEFGVDYGRAKGGSALVFHSAHRWRNRAFLVLKWIGHKGWRGADVVTTLKVYEIEEISDNRDQVTGTLRFYVKCDGVVDIPVKKFQTPGILKDLLS